MIARPPRKCAPDDRSYKGMKSGFGWNSQCYARPTERKDATMTMMRPSSPDRTLNIQRRRTVVRWPWLLLFLLLSRADTTVIAFPNQAGTCDGVGGTHLLAAAATASSLAHAGGGTFVTANGILLPESATIVTIPTTAHRAVHVTVHSDDTLTTFKGALLRFSSSTNDGDWFVTAATGNAREVDTSLCTGDDTVQAISHNHPHPKTQLGALWSTTVTSTTTVRLRVVIVPAHNATDSSYATAEWELRIVVSASHGDDSAKKLQLQAQHSVALAEQDETVACPALCGNGMRIREDATVRWRDSESSSSERTVACHDLLAATSCRMAHALADGCCESSCPPPVCVAWPEAMLDDIMACTDVVRPEGWATLVAQKSCRVSQLLVDRHCGGGCSSSAASTSGAAAGHYYNRGSPRTTTGWGAGTVFVLGAVGLVWLW